MRNEKTVDHQLSRPDSRVRDHLANVRTFLAWVRTSLGLIGIGFVLARMGLFLRQFAMMNASTPHQELRGSHEFLVTGIAFLVLGTFLCLLSGWLYQRSRISIDVGEYDPPRHFVTALTVLVGCGGLIITALLLWQIAI
jgi:putative membrane protein